MFFNIAYHTIEALEILLDELGQSAQQANFAAVMTAAQGPEGAGREIWPVLGDVS